MNLFNPFHSDAAAVPGIKYIEVLKCRSGKEQGKTDLAILGKDFSAKFIHFVYHNNSNYFFYFPEWLISQHLLNKHDPMTLKLWFTVVMALKS